MILTPLLPSSLIRFQSWSEIVTPYIENLCVSLSPIASPALPKMETLEIPQTLSEGPQPTDRRKTLETPVQARNPSPIPDRGEPESRVSTLGPDGAVEKPDAGEGLAGDGKHADTNAGVEDVPVTDYAPSEFLESLHSVALDFSTAEAPEIAKLRSLTAAFVTLKGPVLDLSTTEPGTPPAALMVGSEATNGPGVSEELNQRKKRRSMAELIAEMDFGMGTLDNDETEPEMKQGDNNKAPDFGDGDGDGDGGGMEEEGTASSQRERKKSKYLSPPYTNSSQYSKRAALFNDVAAETPEKDPEPFCVLIPLSPQKEQEKMSLGLKYDSTDVYVILSELLTTAVDPFHLKWNRLAKTVRGFFAEFRSSMYNGSSEFESFNEHPVDSGSINGELMSMELGDGSKVAKSMRKRNKRKDGADDEIPLNLGHDTSERGKVRQRRKVMKDGADGGSLVNLSPVVANGLGGKSKGSAGGKTMIDLGYQKLIDCSEGGLLQKRNRRKGAANHQTPIDSSYEASSFSEGDNLGQEMKKSHIEPNGGLLVGLALKTANGSKRGRSGQKQKIEEALSGSPAALILTFTPGTTLPSEDELISRFSTYGDLIDPKVELLKDSCSARVMFARSSDAEKAFNSPDKRSAFGTPLASCRLRYLPENISSPSVLQPSKKSPLPYIRKSLARMISTLTTSSSMEKGAGSSGCLKLEGMEDLVGDMKGLLEKVDGLMTKPPAATCP